MASSKVVLLVVLLVIAFSHVRSRSLFKRSGVGIITYLFKILISGPSANGHTCMQILTFRLKLALQFTGVYLKASLFGFYSSQFVFNLGLSLNCI